MHSIPYKDFAISVIKNKNVSPELDSAIREGLVECYPEDREFFSRCRFWHSVPEWIVCAFTSDGTVAGHTAIVERVITVGQDAVPVKVAGIQSVFVRPPWRKTGLSGRIMEIVLEEARSRDLDAGLLFCLPVLGDKVYGNMGWRQLDTAVFMKDDSGGRVPLPSKNIAMTIPITIREFPSGDIDLRGPDW